MDEQDAYTIEQFIRRHPMSRALYYKQQAAGLGPKIMKIGNKTLISKEAAAEYRRKMEDPAAEGGWLGDRLDRL
jgi:hypothetical protein